MALSIILSQKLETEQLRQMKERFAHLCQQFNVPATITQQWWEQLLGLYTGPGRYYHNFVHIHNFLQLLDQYQEKIDHPVAFEIAIWWHDAIYEAKRKDNEAKSAQLASECWQSYLSASDLQLVVNLIESTAKHQPLIAGEDCRYFLDFDLGVLGTNSTTYTKYSEAIWQEYKGTFPKILYKVGRKKVLRKFLERPQLFFTSTFYEQYEQQARENIAEEINTL